MTKSKYNKILTYVFVIAAILAVLFLTLMVVFFNASNIYEPIFIAMLAVAYESAFRLIIGVVDEAPDNDKYKYAEGWFAPKSWDLKLFKFCHCEKYAKYVIAVGKDGLPARTCAAEVLHLVSLPLTLIALVFSLFVDEPLRALLLIALVVIAFFLYEVVAIACNRYARLNCLGTMPEEPPLEKSLAERTAEQMVGKPFATDMDISSVSTEEADPEWVAAKRTARENIVRAKAQYAKKHGLPVEEKVDCAVAGATVVAVTEAVSDSAAERKAAIAKAAGEAARRATDAERERLSQKPATAPQEEAPAKEQTKEEQFAQNFAANELAVASAAAKKGEKKGRKSKKNQKNLKTAATTNEDMSFNALGAMLGHVDEEADFENGQTYEDRYVDASGFRFGSGNMFQMRTVTFDEPEEPVEDEKL